MLTFTLNAVYPTPTFTGTNIILRPMKISDFNAIKCYRQDPQNCRYIRPPESDQDVQNMVSQLSKPWLLEEGRWNGLVICFKDCDTAIGEIVFRIDDWQNQRAEIGYRLHAKATGKGVCTQAAKLLIKFLINEMGFYKIVARCDPRNIASFKVMEKLGFQQEAFFKAHYLNGGQWTDQLDYGLLAQDWAN